MSRKTVLSEDAALAADGGYPAGAMLSRFIELRHLRCQPFSAGFPPGGRGSAAAHVGLKR